MRLTAYTFLFLNLAASISAQKMVLADEPTFNSSVEQDKQNTIPLGGRTNFLDGELSPFLNDTYRIGDEWGKKTVTIETLKTASEAFKRAAFATAKVGGATGFYLGTFNGFHVMATNHHVFTRAYACLGNMVKFPLLEKSFKCTKFFGTWTDIDLALFAIDVKSEQDLQKLESVAGNFDFHESFATGTPLLTVGFGIANNASRSLMGNEDSDCKIFSSAGEFRFMPDPDELNPGPYNAWSTSIGCDVSHGDSGSAIVNKTTGRPIGILWTGRIPKAEKIQQSAFLDNLILNPTEDIWKELTFAVPSVKMHSFFTDLLAQGKLDEVSAKTIESIIK